MASVMISATFHTSRCHSFAAYDKGKHKGRGMETGRSLPSALLCERKAELFEHSFKHPGVVGRNVLTSTFKADGEIQVWDYL
ncbi:hypothetical protein INR49_003009 [Caranx melampygus]|nr:hypothetical protein INR49_003009 [Caranx melampygus]